MQKLIIPGRRSLQYKRFLLSTEFVLASGGSYFDTGLAIEITPIAANSLILIRGMLDGLLAVGTSPHLQFRLMRNLTPLNIFGYPAGYTNGLTTIATAPVSLNWDDAPGVAGQTLTYKAQMQLGGGTTSGTINLSGITNSIITVEELL